MQRFFEKRTDNFGNPANGLSCSVYLTGSTAAAPLYIANSTADTPSTGVSNPVITGPDGIVAFAVADGDYDFVFVGADGATEIRLRVNMFDSSTATTIPVSTISLTVPAEFTTTGSPGTSIGIVKAVEAANSVWAGPASGTSAAAPAFRAVVAADVNAVAVDRSTAQTGIAGAKTWTGAQTCSGAVTASTAAVFSTTISVAGVASLLGNVQLEKTSKVKIDSASPDYPWRSCAAIDTGIVTVISAPTVTQFGTAASNIYLWAFDATSPMSKEYVLEVPYDYEAGTDVYLFVDWSSNGTDVGSCRWVFQYTYAKSFNQEAFPALGTNVVVTTAAHGTKFRCMTSVTPAITGATMEPGTKFAFQLYRDAADVADTLTDKAFLHFVGMRYQSSRLGTKNKQPAFFT